jgi:hypothetical protein
MDTWRGIFGRLASGLEGTPWAFFALTKDIFPLGPLYPSFHGSERDCGKLGILSNCAEIFLLPHICKKKYFAMISTAADRCWKFRPRITFDRHMVSYLMMICRLKYVERKALPTFSTCLETALEFASSRPDPARWQGFTLFSSDLYVRDGKCPICYGSALVIVPFRILLFP